MSLAHDSQGFLTGEVIPDIRRMANSLTAIQHDISVIKRALTADRGLSRSSEGSGPSVNPGPQRRARSSADNSAAPRPRSGSSERARNARGRFINGHSDAASPELRRTNRAAENEQGAERQTPPAANNAAPGNTAPASNQVNPAPESAGPPAQNAEPQRRTRILPASDSSEPRPRRRRPSQETAEPRAQRDARGRFTSNNEGDRADEERRQKRLFNGLGDRLAEAATGSNLEELDPTVKAFNEVAEPIQRGYQLFFGGNNDDERWYRKIFGELRFFRRDQSTFNRAEQRTLREIDENTENAGGGSGSGGQSFLGGLLGGSFSGLAARLLPALGMVLSAVFGPVGLAIGAAAAAAWGLFTEDGRQFFANAADSFKVGWDATTTYFKGKWDEGVKVFTELWDPIAKFFEDKFGIVSDGVKTAATAVAETAQKANDFVKGKTGLDVKKSVNTAADSAKSAYQAAKYVARENVIAPAQKAFSLAKDWVLGQTSKLFESGKGGAGTVSTGKGDFGGASYGTYQLSSKQGTLQEFLKSSGYGAQFEGMTPGTKAFNQRWKEIAQQDPAFGTAQHDFIQRTHFDPQVTRLKQGGIDISGRGKAVQDAVWSTAVQFGGNTALIEKALQGKDAANISDADFVSALQDYKIANNGRLFSKSSSNVKSGTLQRAVDEKAKLLNLASSEIRIPPVSQATIQASVPAPHVPVMPMTSVIAEATPAVVPMSGQSGQKRITVSVDRGDVGQDVSDRRMAHIVTGGLSAGV
jgi:hypothetical protein